MSRTKGEPNRPKPIENPVEIDFLRDFIRHSPVAVLLLARDLTCLSHSPKWLFDLGLDPTKDFTGQNLFAAVPRFPRRWEAHFRRALAGEFVDISEDLIEGPDGTELHLNWTVRPWRNLRGEIAGAVFSVEIINELIRSREAYFEVSRMKSEFFATMSHEIRTPLNVINGMTDLLLDTALSAEQREFAAAVKTSGNSLLAVVNDLLDFSRIESGKMLLEITEFSVTDIVEDAAELFAARAYEKGLNFFTEISPEMPPRLLGDSGRLGQVLLNLSSNAVKFTEKGDVILRASLESATGNRASVRFDVIDTGIGLSASDCKKIFQPFTQVDGSMSRKYGGTGLGLSLSKKLINMMHGDLSVASELAGGSCFSFLLPFEVPPTAKLAPEAPRRRRHVLLGDDHPKHGEILKSYLTQDAAVDEVSTPSQLWAKLAAQSAGGVVYDCVLLNFSQMRSENLEIAKKIHATVASDRLRVCVLLSPYEKILKPEFLSKGAPVSCLTKPVRLRELRDVVLGEDPEHGMQHRRYAHDLDAPPKKNAPILVVEDNPVNRQVAMLHLKKLGYSCHSVANGAEAVEAMALSAYSLILMDCQMPEMDGFEATRAIRKMERAGRARTPIVAMTANAMLGDKEKCLMSGMDDYIAKPVTLDHLGKVLRRWLRPSADGAANEATPAAVDEDPVLDRGMLGSLMELERGGTEILSGLIELYLKTTTERLHELSQSVKKKDVVLFKRVAHTLKSSSAQLGAKRLAAYCFRLEQKSAIPADEIDSIMSTLESEYSKVKEALGAIER